MKIKSRIITLIAIAGLFTVNAGLVGCSKRSSDSKDAKQVAEQKKTVEQKQAEIEQMKQQALAQEEASKNAQAEIKVLLERADLAEKSLARANAELENIESREQALLEESEKIEAIKIALVAEQDAAMKAVEKAKIEESSAIENKKSIEQSIVAIQAELAEAQRKVTQAEQDLNSATTEAVEVKRKALEEAKDVEAKANVKLATATAANEEAGARLKEATATLESANKVQEVALQNQELAKTMFSKLNLVSIYDRLLEGKSVPFQVSIIGKEDVKKLREVRAQVERINDVKYNKANKLNPSVDHVAYILEDAGTAKGTHALTWQEKLKFVGSSSKVQTIKDTYLVNVKPKDLQAFQREINEKSKYNLMVIVRLVKKVRARMSLNFYGSEVKSKFEPQANYSDNPIIPSIELNKTFESDNLLDRGDVDLTKPSEYVGSSEDIKSACAELNTKCFSELSSKGLLDQKILIPSKENYREMTAMTLKDVLKDKINDSIIQLKRDIRAIDNPTDYTRMPIIPSSKQEFVIDPNTMERVPKRTSHNLGNDPEYRKIPNILDAISISYQLVLVENMPAPGLVPADLLVGEDKIDFEGILGQNIRTGEYELELPIGDDATVARFDFLKLAEKEAIESLGVNKINAAVYRERAWNQMIKLRAILGELK